MGINKLNYDLFNFRITDLEKCELFPPEISSQLEINLENGAQRNPRLYSAHVAARPWIRQHYSRSLITTLSTEGAPSAQTILAGLDRNTTMLDAIAVYDFLNCH